MTALTKREQFAMAAMQGLMSDFEAVYESCPTGVMPADYAVSVAVVIADKMIAALEKNDE